MMTMVVGKGETLAKPPFDWFSIRPTRRPGATQPKGKSKLPVPIRLCQPDPANRPPQMIAPVKSLLAGYRTGNGGAFFQAFCRLQLKETQAESGTE